MVRRMYRIPWIAALLVAGCNGSDDGEDDGAQPIEDYACFQLAAGELVDFSEVREEARTITVGREPWRVNVIENTVGYLAFETSGATDLVLLVDFVRSV